MQSARRNEADTIEYGWPMAGVNTRETTNQFSEYGSVSENLWCIKQFWKVYQSAFCYCNKNLKQPVRKEKRLVCGKHFGHIWSQLIEKGPFGS